MAYGINHAPPYSIMVKERVELYLYSPPELLGLLQGKLYFPPVTMTLILTAISISHIIYKPYI
jgi:hypothetical protein